MDKVAGRATPRGMPESFIFPPGLPPGPSPIVDAPGKHERLHWDKQRASLRQRRIVGLGIVGTCRGVGHKSGADTDGKHRPFVMGLKLCIPEILACI